MSNRQDNNVGFVVPIKYKMGRFDDKLNNSGIVDCSQFISYFNQKYNYSGCVC